jgi:hypothetical protein
MFSTNENYFVKSYFILLVEGNRYGINKESVLNIFALSEQLFEYYEQI